MLISVVTMSYNNIMKLFATIDSILMQDYPSIEIILSDDGTEGFDPETFEKYINENKKSNIKDFHVLASANNMGTVRNANKAYSFCKGEVIVNLSSGDVFFDEEVIKKIALKFVDDKIKVLFPRRMLVDKDTKRRIKKIPSDLEVLCIQRYFNSSEKQFKKLFTGDFYNAVSGCVQCIRSDYFHQLQGFDENYFLWEDGPLYTKITQSGEVLTFDFDLFSIYYEDGGVSSGKLSDKMKKDLSLFLKSGLSMHDFSFFEKRIINERLYVISNESNKMRFLFYLDVYVYKLIKRVHYFYLKTFLIKSEKDD